MVENIHISNIANTNYTYQLKPETASDLKKNKHKTQQYATDKIHAHT